MALTDAQRESVYEYLGFPTVTEFGSPSQTLATILDNMSSNAESRVVALIDLITTSRGDILSAQGRLKASEVGDIKLNQSEIKQRWQEDYRLCEQLSILLGVGIRRHPAKRSAPEVC